MGLHDQIAALMDRFDAGDLTALDPSPTVDAVFGDLVAQLVDPALGRDVVERACARIDHDPGWRTRAGTIRRAAAAAETAMERFHASAIASRRGQAHEMASAVAPFPYYDNYESLVGAEAEGITPLRGDREQRRVAFCGAGPLPLSGVLWRRLTGDDVAMLEVDADAARLASGVVSRLVADGLCSPVGLDVVTADAATIDARLVDVVIVASLVPAQSVAAIANRLAVDGGQVLLAVRSAVGLTARFAYERIDPGEIEALGFEHLGTVAPATAVYDGPVAPAVGVARTDPALLSIAPAGVLNTTDLFRPRR